MQLNILPDGNVGLSARITLRELANGAQLTRGENAVRNPDAQHEILGGFSLATLAADRAHAITLRVNAPPFEVHARPLRRNAAASLPREFTDFRDALPWILLALQPF